MDKRSDMIIFLVIITVFSIFWGRVNRIAGASKLTGSIAHFSMKYSRMKSELIRSCLVWSIYMLAGLVAPVVLLVAYRIDFSPYFALNPGYFILIPLAFIGQNSMTGLLMQLVIVARPTLNVFMELTSIPWVSYTLAMPSMMRVLSPLGAAVLEELFFRGAVFLILINRFPEIGVVLPVVICTVLFVMQQVLQTNTVGQGLILAVGSTSVSVVGCIVTLCTGSFLPTLLCHTAYAFIYLKLGTSTGWRSLGSIATAPVVNANERSGSVYRGF
jgi:membrane protease YdiL (CAAX protease family)